MVVEMNIQHLIKRSVGLVGICIIRGISELKMAIKKRFEVKFYRNEINFYENVNDELKRAELKNGVK